MNEVRVRFQPDVQIVNDRSSAIRVQLGQQGPRGAPGEAGSGGGGENVTSTRTASAALSGHRVVKLLSDGTVDYADAANSADAAIVLGVTLGAAISGGDIQIREVGEIVEGSWSWTAGLPVWLGSTGHLTQSPPASPAAFSLIVGFASAADTVCVRIESPILL
jgi:hypothetical protein